jgi:hypothetical protein
MNDWGGMAVETVSLDVGGRGLKCPPDTKIRAVVESRVKAWLVRDRALTTEVWECR